MDTSWLRSPFEELKACSGASREALLETLSPTRCAGCERPGVLLCDDCLNKLVLIDPEESCALCGAPLWARFVHGMSRRGFIARSLFGLRAF